MRLPLDLSKYCSIVFFTGAGMSAESGIWTYRGKGGLWNEYNWQEYACERAFKLDPEKVLKFHEMRREKIFECQPHEGHYLIARLEQEHKIRIITQNIDGMHQKAGSRNVIELHGSHWRLRCPKHGIRNDYGKNYKNYKCEKCGSWLRPDIIWFEDRLDENTINEAIETVLGVDLFISIGTSAVVWPAAGMPRYAKQNNALCIEINPEQTEMSGLYDLRINEPASSGLITLLGNL
jgi:NAD-dependent deacetylase